MECYYIKYLDYVHWIALNKLIMTNLIYGGVAECVDGSGWLWMIEDVFGWLWMFSDGCGCFRTVVDVFGWLWMFLDGCGWL